jgi:hypothetical protein
MKMDISAERTSNAAQRVLGGRSDSPVERVSRRAVVRSAAWSVPVIAAAAATPLAAASVTFKITLSTGTYITAWRGDHHYGSANSNATRRSYDFPVKVTDSAGNPISGATVTVTASGRNRDGDLLGVYAYPAPSNGGPESSPHPAATLITDSTGQALFAVNTQNLSSGERPATAYLTVTITYNGTTVTEMVTVFMTLSD